MPISITPGPWRTGFTIPKTGAQAIQAADGEWVAWSVGEDGVRTRTEAHQNARAIAALPELLEVLLNLEAWGRADDAQGFAGETDYDELERIQEAAAAALRKAGAL